LSFEQISEILRYLNADQQKLLLEYFFAQSAVDATIAEINTDYFRGVPQERKYAAIETLQSVAEKLESAARNLHIALGGSDQSEAAKLESATDKLTKAPDKQGCWAHHTNQITR